MKLTIKQRIRLLLYPRRNCANCRGWCGGMADHVGQCLRRAPPAVSPADDPDEYIKGSRGEYSTVTRHWTDWFDWCYEGKFSRLNPCIHFKDDELEFPQLIEERRIHNHFLGKED